MTKDKTKTRNSFILHLDSLKILDKMTPIQAGTFIKLIYEYQKTGKIKKIDFSMEMAIIPFLNQFKRDEKKYRGAIDNGKIGNLKRYHEEIYHKYMAGKITLEDAENLAYPNKKEHSSRPPRQPETTPSPPIQPHRPSSLNVNVNVNDNNNSLSLTEPKFKKPTFEEIRKFVGERKIFLKNKGKDFFDYYEVSGWLDSNKKSILDRWRQRAVAWSQDDKNVVPVDERVEVEVEDLKAMLIGRTNGKEKNFIYLKIALKQHFGANIYNSWISKLKVKIWDRCNLILYADTTFVREYIKDNFFKDTKLRKGIEGIVQEMGNKKGFPKFKNISILNETY